MSTTYVCCSSAVLFLFFTLFSTCKPVNVLELYVSSLQQKHRRSSNLCLALSPLHTEGPFTSARYRDLSLISIFVSYQFSIMVAAVCGLRLPRIATI